MAYNYFPATYQPLNYAQQTQNNASIIWVQGIAGAKAYPVAPSNSVQLMDSESDHFFIKSTDASGMPMPLRVFEYKEVSINTPQKTPQVAQPDMSDFVRRDEFVALSHKIDGLLNKEEVIDAE